MKAGINIHVQRLELLGGQVDAVPRRLYTTDGVQVDITKHYLAGEKSATLVDTRGRQYVTDKQGWVKPVEEPADGNQ